MRQCKKCLVFKSEDEFYKAKCNYGQGWRYLTSCKACCRAASSAYQKTPRGKATMSRLRKGYNSHPRVKYARSVKIREVKYGISPRKQEEMMISQNARCGCCGDALALGHSTHLDHNHKTGAVRAFICLHCNNALGYVRDEVWRAEKLVDYLKKHQAPTAVAA